MKSTLISLLVLISFAAQAQAADLQAFGELEIQSVTRNMQLVNPEFSAVTGGQITFNEKTIHLSISKSMPACPEDMMCIQVIPPALQINLTVVNIEQTACSVKYTAVTAPNIYNNINEEVVIEDFTNSTCEMMLTSLASVSYTATGISSLTGQSESAQANFVLQGQFSFGTENNNNSNRLDM